jgi:hypothetical protein
MIRKTRRRKKGRLERERREVGILNFGRQEDGRLYLER